MNRSRTIQVLAAGTAVVTLTVPLAAAPVGAAAGTLTTGHCTNGATVTLQLQHSDPGRIEAGFEIDHAKPGSTWSVRLVHNGAAYFRGRRTAAVPGGTFSVDRVLSDLRGSDHVSGRAVNLATGAVCSVTAAV
jgi:hypothetical protein